MAACGAVEEMLAEMVAAANLIAADKVGVVGLQLCRGHNAVAKDFGARAGGVTL